MADRCRIFIGNIIHCKMPFEMEVLEKGFVVVENEKILVTKKIDDLPKTKKLLSLKNVEEILLTDTQFLIPGLVDTHIHAPQYPNLGLGYDKQLLDWLQTYTFPVEKKYSNPDFAKKVYKLVVKNTLSYGTTTACYFGTMHLNSTIELANAAIIGGQRAFIGKVNMIEMCPADLSETFEQSLKSTDRFIRVLLDKKCERVRPIITPRFALSCSLELMQKLAVLAKRYDINIQSHISENKQEVLAVEEKFGVKYAEVYNNCNLLTSKTVLAHGIHLSYDEMKLLAKKETSISHCPTSNFCLQSGNCDVIALINAGVNVGLGTDVSGGSTPSMIEVMRTALFNSIQLSFNGTNKKPLDYADVFYLATLGGAKALGIDKIIGSFEVGKFFDAVIVDINSQPSRADCTDKMSARELLQKFIFTADDRHVSKVYVSGRQVKYNR